MAKKSAHNPAHHLRMAHHHMHEAVRMAKMHEAAGGRKANKERREHKKEHKR